MRDRIIFLMIAIVLCISPNALASTDKKQETTLTQHEIFELNITATKNYDWWLFPVSASFEHAESKKKITVKGIWTGNKKYLLRFAPTLPGKWTYKTQSDDSGMNNISGVLEVVAPTSEQIAENPNYRGSLGISNDGRYYHYADGTPFFFMGDTNWAINTARCGLGDEKDGPFYQYLNDRKSKGFTAILMGYMHGYGDYADGTGQRNEGGAPFLEKKFEQLNPDYFKYLDKRMETLWQMGFMSAPNITWFGKRSCSFTLEWAKRISAYLMNRYAARTGMISLTGEYQYAMKDCDWTDAQIDEIGTEVQKNNTYGVPVSIHPSSRLDWPEGHNLQSSGGFVDSEWLDTNWLQTGQSESELFNIPARLDENRKQRPDMPVLLSEAYYEEAVDSLHTYHARWQPWVAYLNAASGFGYGAWGMWQFFDPADPEGETGKDVRNISPWWEAIGYEGSQQHKFVAEVLQDIPWWQLAPQRDWLTVDGNPNPMPTTTDISPPHCATVGNDLFLIYIPRGNAEKKISLSHLDRKNYKAKWISPRSGVSLPLLEGPEGQDEWTIPKRPENVWEDWVLMLERY